MTSETKDIKSSILPTVFFKNLYQNNKTALPLKMLIHGIISTEKLNNYF